MFDYSNYIEDYDEIEDRESDDFVNDDSECSDIEIMLSKCNTSSEYINVLKYQQKLNEMEHIKIEEINHKEKLSNSLKKNIYDNKRFRADFLINQWQNEMDELEQRKKPKTERSFKNIFLNLKAFVVDFL